MALELKPLPSRYAFSGESVVVVVDDNSITIPSPDNELHKQRQQNWPSELRSRLVQYRITSYEIGRYVRVLQEKLPEEIVSKAMAKTFKAIRTVQLEVERYGKEQLSQVSPKQLRFLVLEEISISSPHYLYVENERLTELKIIAVMLEFVGMWGDRVTCQLESVD
ncbi:hypothetical protein ACQ4M4_10715 [Leptolyngbya sp. AN02str]|uniref:hypothetical protein n=1 Tax=Leptolyngbya sp. AN02str TaxID=3423363 RepID=UPI003D317AFE